jgi:hypothetical protein
MSSLNSPLTKDDFINSRWQDVVNSSERKECFTYSQAFWKKVQEAKEAGNVREQAVLEILAVVTSAAIQPESTEEFFAEVFRNITDEHLDFLAEIAPEISDPELQARVADILWVKRRDYRMAQLAVIAYLQSATGLEDIIVWILCFNRIERALRLARRIRYQVEAVVAHIEAVLDRYNGEDPSWLSAKLMGLLQEYRLGDPTKYAALAEKAATLFDEDTLFDLQGLLIEESGSNLRNRMAHGLINDNGFLHSLMSYLWWLTLRLCCLPIWDYQQKAEQSEPWVKFAGMFKDDPLFDEFVEDMAAYRRELDAEIADSESASEENQSV